MLVHRAPYHADIYESNSFDLSKAEEAPSALLLAQAALLSAKKNARRRSALWYVSAANRLEKCGIVSWNFCADVLV